MSTAALTLGGRLFTEELLRGGSLLCSWIRHFNQGWTRGNQCTINHNHNGTKAWAKWQSSSEKS